MTGVANEVVEAEQNRECRDSRLSEALATAGMPDSNIRLKD